LSLNAMLAQIQTAFEARKASEDRLRRFVADASHELRTPLTSIRGYAELFRRGAADRPEDLATAMRRIEQESARMGVLVDDLLLLARLDQGRPLERRPGGRRRPRCPGRRARAAHRAGGIGAGGGAG
jgi:two-component system OmpR family sensor kinase